MKNILLLLIILIFACNGNNVDLEASINPCDSFDIDTILIQLEKMAQCDDNNEELVVKYNEVIQYLYSVKDNNEELFPFSGFDSIVYKSYSKEDEFISPLEERKILKEKRLDINKIKSLICVLNNPLNYGSWECGTIIPSERILIYNKKDTVAEILFASGYNEVITKPENKLIWGGLNVGKDSIINLIGFE